MMKLDITNNKKEAQLSKFLKVFELLIFVLFTNYTTKKLKHKFFVHNF